MTDPRRLREERPESLEATLLDALRSEQPSEAARERVVRTLIATGAVAGATLPAAKASAKASTLAWPSAWSIAGVGAAAALALGVSLMVVPRAKPPSALPQRAALTAPDQPTPQAEAVEQARSAASQSGGAANHPAQPAPASTARRSKRASKLEQSARRPAAGLSHELAALSAVKRALEVHASDLALERLAVYEQTYPAGYLHEEGLLLRAEALLEANQAAGARRVALGLIERSPNGPLVERARALVARADRRIKEQVRGQ
jgi:hypothetical protein